MEHRNGVHKYKTHFQAEWIIYNFTPQSTNITCRLGHELPALSDPLRGIAQRRLWVDSS